MFLTWQQNFKLLWFVTVHYLNLFQITLKVSMMTWAHGFKYITHSCTLSNAKKAMKEIVTHRQASGYEWMGLLHDPEHGRIEQKEFTKKKTMNLFFLKN